MPDVSYYIRNICQAALIQVRRRHAYADDTARGGNSPRPLVREIAWMLAYGKGI